MIAYIEGKIAELDPTYTILDIHGVGYQIFISLNTFEALKGIEHIKLFTHQHIKEDANTLYGFISARDKKLFLDLISISGVGPSTGLMILSSLSVEEIQRAIVNEEVKIIQSVKGIGAKTAQRIILELKDKMKKEGILANATTPASATHNTTRNEALQALVTLGINKNTAEKTVDTILKQAGDAVSVEELIKLALKSSR
jgi:holliday junction DNA helicase RuvA